MRFSGFVLSLMIYAVLTNTSFATPSLNTNNYQVQPNDTLSSLAQRFLGSDSRWRDIWAANPYITNPNQIKAGSTLAIPDRDDSHSVNASNFSNKLDMYRPLAQEFLANPSHISSLDRMHLIHQTALHKQLHLSVIDFDSNSVKIFATTESNNPIENYLVLKENIRLAATTGEILDTRIYAYARVTSRMTGFLTLEAANIFGELNSTEIFVVPDTRTIDRNQTIQVHTPELGVSAKVLHVIYNEPNNLFAVIDVASNQSIQPGGLVRYRNSGTPHDKHDGVLLILDSITGASYAVVLSATAPPMPTAAVF